MKDFDSIYLSESDKQLLRDLLKERIMEIIMEERTTNDDTESDIGYIGQMRKIIKELNKVY